MDIDSSLLREKFDIIEKSTDKGEKALKIVCPSTRMVIDLKSKASTPERFVIRTNNMHSCVRMVAQMISEFERRGPIAHRDPPLDWLVLWSDALSNYDRTYNDKRWVSIHYEGNPVYSYGEYHPFFDVIEKFDYLSNGKYEDSIARAEEAFKESGKDVRIEYDTNVALVAVLNKDGGRCSMILRGPIQTTTFNYSLRPNNPTQPINTAKALGGAADFLEGVQLCYMIGINLEKLNHGIIERNSYEDKQTVNARRRISQLDAQINSMENMYTVRYRPERPDFNKLIHLAEEFAKNYVIKDRDDDEYVD